MFLSEFNRENMSADTLAAFAALEQAYGSPFTVNSAYRSPEHNEAVGGAKNSQHMQGNAIDVDVSGLSEAERISLIQMARQAGFGGVGVYDNALHFDTGPTRYWGPDYTGASLPSWAAPAVGAERGEITPMQGGGSFKYPPRKHPCDLWRRATAEQRAFGDFAASEKPP